MPINLSTFSERSKPVKINLRGIEVEVRHVPASVHRAIESQIPYPQVISDDPEKAEAYKRTPKYKAKMHTVDVQRQIARFAYSIDLEHEGRSWTPDAPPEWVDRLVKAAAETFDYNEIDRAYQAALMATGILESAQTQIGSDHTQGN